MSVLELCVSALLSARHALAVVVVFFLTSTLAVLVIFLVTDIRLRFHGEEEGP